MATEHSHSVSMCICMTHDYDRVSWCLCTNEIASGNHFDLAMAWDTYLLKNTLYAVNMCGAFIGFFAIVVGSIFQHNFGRHLKLLSDDYDLHEISIALIVVGVLVVGVSTVGSMGIVNDSHIALMLFAALLGTIAVGELMIGGMAMYRLNAIQTILERGLRHLWRNKETHVSFWNTLQFVWSCCGIDSNDDWEHTPFSCCDPFRSMYYFCYASVNAFHTPCLHSLREYTAKYSAMFGVTAFVLAAIHLFGVTIASCLAVKLYAQRRRQWWLAFCWRSKAINKSIVIKIPVVVCFIHCGVYSVNDRPWYVSPPHSSIIQCRCFRPTAMAQFVEQSAPPPSMEKQST